MDEAQIQSQLQAQAQDCGESKAEEEKFCILCEMEQHLIRVHKSGDVVSPNSIVHGFIQHVAPWFKLGVQEDSHEFLRLLIDAMEKSCVTTRQLQLSSQSLSQKMGVSLDSSYSAVAGDSGSGDVSGSGSGDVSVGTTATDDAGGGTSCTIPTSSVLKPTGNEYPFRLFCGEIESIVKCSSCSNISSKIDPIEDIGLEVRSSFTQSNSNWNPSASSSFSSSLMDVMQSFQKFTATESLDCSYKCESCGKVGKATKQVKLKSIPPILTLHLKRFRYGNERMAISSSVPSRRRTAELSGLLVDGGSSGSAKIEGHVRFPQVFDIRPYLTQEVQSQMKSMLCRLFAVIVHSGKNSHSGHYVSYVRNVSKNEWWKMDDARVTLVSKEEVFAAEAYMLFYRVVDHPVSIDLKQKQDKILQQPHSAFEVPSTTPSSQSQLQAQLQLQLQAQGGVAVATNKEDSGGGGGERVDTTAISTVTANIATSVDAIPPQVVEEVAQGGTKAVTKVQQDRLQETTSPHMVPNTSSTSSTFSTTAAKDSSVKKRKREVPEYKSGEEWARKMTTKPKSMLHFIRAAQDYLCERIEFKPEYIQWMKDEVESGNRVQNGPSFGISLQEDVLNFHLLDGFRHALWTMFQQVLPTDKVEMEALLKPKEKKNDDKGGNSSRSYSGSTGGGKTAAIATTVVPANDSHSPQRPQDDNVYTPTTTTTTTHPNVTMEDGSTKINLIIPVVEHNDNLL